MLCACGQDLSALYRLVPSIELQCRHDGSFTLNVGSDVSAVVRPGDRFEVKWRVDYPPGAARPMIWRVKHPIQSIDNDDDPVALIRAGADAIPDGIEPLVGYRAWRLDGGKLRSIVWDYEWVPGENVATCQFGMHHVSLDLLEARQRIDSCDDPVERGRLITLVDHFTTEASRSPERNCRCGFYAMLRPEDILEQVKAMDGDFVLGRVLLWGKVGKYSQGYRAEKARIDAIFRPADPLARWRIHRVARNYGVKVEKSPIRLSNRRRWIYWWAFVLGGALVSWSISPTILAAALIGSGLAVILGSIMISRH